MGRRSVSLLLAVFVMSSVVVVAGAGSASTTLEVVDVELVSVASDGTQGSGQNPAVSSDGTTVAFSSHASNLVEGDTNGEEDVFVHDRSTGVTTRVSVASDGTQAEYMSDYPAVSADGSVVAFWSEADNLVEGDTNEVGDVFVHDRRSGTTHRVSVASDGSQATGSSGYPDVSDDGTIVVFSSYADDLIASDTNEAQDVFVHDRASGNTARISVSSDGTQAAGGTSYAPAIAGDGQVVAFLSWASNLVAGDTNLSADVFAHDRNTGTTSRVSVASDGTQANDRSFSSALSFDGSVVAYGSRANNLVPDDTNESDDVFIHDRTTTATTRASVASDGTQANSFSLAPTLSHGGALVAFYSGADNLISGDTNGVADAFVHNRATGVTTRISIAFDGSEANDQSWGRPVLSGDGGAVAYDSYAENLVPGDSNEQQDVFVASLTAASHVQVDAAATCDEVVVSWSASHVAGWRIEVGYPPGYWYATGLTEPSGFVSFGEPWLFGTYTVALYDEHDDLVPGSEEVFELGQPAGCGYANVMIAGGTAVVSDGVEDDLGGLSRSVTRVAGANRYATAAAISEAHFPQLDDEGQPVLIATGENWPDALAGGPAAARFGGPILLVQKNSIPAVTATELRRLDPAWIAVLGGTAVISNSVEHQLEGFTDGDVFRLAGRNRYATAAAISKESFDPGVDAVYVATGLNFPDALAGGPAAAVRQAPILLVQRDAVPGDTAAELRRLDPGRIYILGGTAVVSTGVANQLGSYTDGAVVRLAGRDRYATAAAICADTFGSGPSPSMAYIATGLNFPDGLTAGPVAGIGGSPILLVTRDTIPSPTQTELHHLNN